MTPKLWAPLNPARQDASFGTSPIGHTVPEILSDGKIPEQEQEQQEYITFLRDRFVDDNNFYMGLTNHVFAKYNQQDPKFIVIKIPFISLHYWHC